MKIFLKRKNYTTLLPIGWASLITMISQEKMYQIKISENTFKLAESEGLEVRVNGKNR